MTTQITVILSCPVLSLKSFCCCQVSHIHRRCAWCRRLSLDVLPVLYVRSHGEMSRANHSAVQEAQRRVDELHHRFTLFDKGSVNMHMLTKYISIWEYLSCFCVENFVFLDVKSILYCLLLLCLIKWNVISLRFFCQLRAFTIRQRSWDKLSRGLSLISLPIM